MFDVIWQVLMVILLCAILVAIVMFAKTLYKYLKNSENAKKAETSNKVFGDIIKKHRKDSNLTRSDVAKHLGVSEQEVLKWENGNLYPNASNLSDIAKLFGVTVEDLLKEIEDKSSM